MAQLNPNFEIDFSDINSYEQIQLINDTQLAKENLLMHRAYKEPSDDEIIRNHFSSFTFVDFCPKLFSAQPSASARQQATSSAGIWPNCDQTNSGAAGGGKSLKYYELETFSDLFERINTWLKLNKDWRVVSMETLVYDCTSQFNHVKSSIYSSYLPQNTRGLRLFLSPSKSRFSGPQKIGCINVVPRKVSGRYTKPDEPIIYETLDEILHRLNELLLTRPIEGRILSVETITLPMVDGYVNTESNYFMDSRLNMLNLCTYSVANGVVVANPNQQPSFNSTAQLADPKLRGNCLMDILRVYYEFGPVVCGLVNLIDFIPRFYSPTPTTTDSAPTSGGGCRASSPETATTAQYQDSASGVPTTTTTTGESSEPTGKPMEKIAATESLTRLVRRSLAWFEFERKRILSETNPCRQQQQQQQEVDQQSKSSSISDKAVNLKVCNLQVHHKTLLKSQLIKINSSNALQCTNTRIMAHERMTSKAPIVCVQCLTSTNTDPIQSWCTHLAELSQPYELKFVRLAYVVPVYNKYARSALCPLRPLRSSRKHNQRHQHQRTSSGSSQVSFGSRLTGSNTPISELSSSSTSSSSETSTPDSSPMLTNPKYDHLSEQVCDKTMDSGASSQQQQLISTCIDDASDTGAVLLEAPSASKIVTADETTLLEGGKALLEEAELAEEWAKQAALDILNGTIKRHRKDEEAHQLKQSGDDALNDSPIGQLTYRLFAPCQLVKSSSCFSINPVNSSSPLARRGSVDLNGSGISSENAHPSTSLLGGSGAQLSSSSENHHHHHHHHQITTSFGAFFPSLSQDIISGSSESAASSTSSTKHQAAGGGGSRFTTNEFEPVDAIRRRMEIYVTTNSMKVIAGETLVVNLSDALSCLSTAIEQTVIKTPYTQRRSSTWVSVYVLYAAVEEPQLPGQLLAQQKLRELTLINEEAGGEEEERLLQLQADSIFDDDFKGSLPVEPKTITNPKQAAEISATIDQKEPAQKITSTSLEEPAAVITSNGSIRIEQNPVDSSLTLYNSAYDRTVALPTPPENHLTSLEPVDFFDSPAGCLWLNDNDLIEAQQKHQQSVELESRKARKKNRKAKSRKKQEDSQCSIM